jgi:DNA-binding HxlR family transcriptional regulator
MPARKSYKQNCPIAKSLDLVGERWTLLILRELLGGPRRYSDLRAELPGIATNLLAERLKELQDAGLIDRAELPPPIARTVYSLSDAGWQRVPSILQSIAWLGLDRLDPLEPGPVAPLTGFLAGFVIPFDPRRTEGLTAVYCVEIDGRRFEFGIDQGRMAAAHGRPDVVVTASAVDLATARLGSTDAKRKTALRQIAFEGDHDAVEALREAFSL